MYTVGRLGSYISRGAYTVSGPFHPFGGAVDIIVVEQPDGSFKSSPWYVRFGKFQGVLKSKEKAVNVSVNDVEANFHMYLDHKGGAHFLRELDVEDGDSVLYPSSSGDEIDVQSDSNRKRLKSKSCNYDAGELSSADQFDIKDGRVVSSTTSSRRRILGLVFGRRSMKEDSAKGGTRSPGVERSNSLECAEIAADLLEVKWSTSLVSRRSKKDKASKLSVCEVLDNKGSKDLQIHDEKIKLDTSLHNDKLEHCIDNTVLQVETDFCNNQTGNSFQTGIENIGYPIDEAGIQMSCVSPMEQVVVTNSSGESFLEEKCELISETSGMIDENDVQSSNHNENQKAVDMGMGESDMQIHYKLKACPDMQFDEEEINNKRDVLQGCGIAIEERVPDIAWSFAYCETSQSSVVNVPNEQLQETLCLSTGGHEQVHIHAETVPRTTGLLVEDMFVKQAEEMELDVKETLKIPESYTQTVYVGHMLGSVKEVETCHTSSCSNVGHSDGQIQESIKSVLHPPLQSICDPQKICADSDTTKSFSPSEPLEEEQFLFSDLDEFKIKEQLCGNEEHQSFISTNGKEVIGLLDMNNPETPPNNLENSLEKSGMTSDPINVKRSHSVSGEDAGWQSGLLPNILSPDDKSHTHNHCLLSHSLGSNPESLELTPIRKNYSSCRQPVAVKEFQLSEDKSNPEDAEASMLLEEALKNPTVEVSLCKRLLNKGMGAAAAAQAFDSEKLDVHTFSSLGPAVVKNDQLVVRISGQYFPWDAASPILLGMVASGSERLFELKGAIIVEKSLEETQSKSIDSCNRSWKLWPFSSKGSRSNKQLAQGFVKVLAAENTAEGTVGCPQGKGNGQGKQPAQDGARISAAKNADDNRNALIPKKVKKMAKVNTPTSEQLASLNLKEGRNAVTFTFSTAMLGKQQVQARIFLWKWNTRIVISDVDGTITKSDVLGQFMPLVGMDWSQTGVAHLFSAIKENDYQLLFLSARSISQAYHTRQFLINLKQNGKALPDGPIVISPDGLLPSLFREVIRRAPHEFKIACLEDIKALFPSDCNPFYAGFGNRDTDEISYLKVGIPKGKIFIINPKGEVAVHRCVDTKSYTSLHALVHGMFPIRPSSEQEDFNSWNYWKLPPPEIKL
ncbi:hypothetical protein SLA2020_207080 [Shorea laevis]